MAIYSKQFLVDRIAARHIINKAVAAQVVDDVFSAMIVGLQTGNEFRISSFGTFSRYERGARVGRNPATGAAVDIPARAVLKFKPSKSLNL